jgi:hypothetical protein
MACECESNRYVPYVGMGQIDVDAFAGVLAGAKVMWENLVEALGIGAGRKEADIIVPIQNKVVNDIIAPIYAFDDAILNHDQPVDCNEARTYLASVTTAEQQWLNYLHLTKWADGRAAQQAEASLQPYFANCKRDLNTIINTKCSTIGGTVGDVIGDTIGSIIRTPTGETNWPVILGITGLAFMFLRKK